MVNSSQTKGFYLPLPHPGCWHFTQLLDKQTPLLAVVMKGLSTIKHAFSAGLSLSYHPGGLGGRRYLGWRILCVMPNDQTWEVCQILLMPDGHHSTQWPDRLPFGGWQFRWDHHLKSNIMQLQSCTCNLGNDIKVEEISCSQNQTVEKSWLALWNHEIDVYPC